MKWAYSYVLVSALGSYETGCHKQFIITILLLYMYKHNSQYVEAETIA